jgi:hypothetical protein
MVQTLTIEKLTIYDLEQQFGLQEVANSSFFAEWQEDLPALSSAEQERLARVEVAYADEAPSHQFVEGVWVIWPDSAAW